LASVFGVLAGPASADHVKHSLANAERLIAACKSDVPALRGMCLGYLSAMADGIARHQKVGIAARTVCVPEEVDLEAYRRAVLTFAEKSAPAAEGHSFEMVKSALEAVWPCGR